MSHIKLGKYNQLEVVKEVDFGVYSMEMRTVKSCFRNDMCPKVPNRETF